MREQDDPTPFDINARIRGLETERRIRPCPRRLVAAFVAACDDTMVKLEFSRQELSVCLECEVDTIDRLAIGEYPITAGELADLWSFLDDVRDGEEHRAGREFTNQLKRVADGLEAVVSRLEAVDKALSR